MGESGEGNTETMQRMYSSFGTSSSSIPKQPLNMNYQLDIPQFNANQIRARHFSQFAQNFSSGDSSKRVGIPPSHPNQIPPISPYSQIPVTRSTNQQPVSSGPQSFNPGRTHSRSLSQPSSFYSLDSLPPLSPFSQTNSIADHDVSMEDRDGGGSGSGSGSHSLLPPSPFPRANSRVGESLPPRKAHRRSNSDIPFGFNSMIQSPPSLIPLRGSGGLERSVSGGESYGWDKPFQLVKRESCWEKGGDSNGEGMSERNSEGEITDDLISAYMNLDNIDALNSSGTDDNKYGHDRDEMDSSKASGTKINGCDSSENEAESSFNESGNGLKKAGMTSLGGKRESVKRSAGEDIAPTTRHQRSVSLDSFMGKLNFNEESSKLPPSPGIRPGQLSPSSSMDNNSNQFNLDFGNGEFSGAELKKIMANEKLAEIALNDPKRAKRILANRQSAARSKERKMRYISELEHKVQTLQTEATTLSAQLTLLQRDSVGLTNKNNELKFRLQAMEQQARLREALNEALNSEVRRLKIATAELSSDLGAGSNPSKYNMNPQGFYQQQQQQKPNDSSSGKAEADK